jgi:phage terminase small subunit
VQPEVEIPGCPKHLMPEARKEWRRITPELEHLGLVSKIDRAALALYCQAWARWVWCEQQLSRAQELAAAKRAEWEAKPENEGKAWAGGDGFMIPTPNGSFTYSPHWVGANKAMEQVDKFLASFGLSPSSRGRVTPSSRTAYLPGMDPKEGFGAL